MTGVSPTIGPGTIFRSLDLPVGGDLLLQGGRLQGVDDGALELRVVDGLRDEIVGPAAHGRHDVLDHPEGGDHDDGQIGPALPEILQEVRSLARPEASCPGGRGSGLSSVSGLQAGRARSPPR